MVNLVTDRTCAELEELWRLQLDEITKELGGCNQVCLEIQLDGGYYEVSSKIDW